MEEDQGKNDTTVEAVDGAQGRSTLFGRSFCDRQFIFVVACRRHLARLSDATPGDLKPRLWSVIESANAVVFSA